MDIESNKISDGSVDDLDVLEGSFIAGIHGWLIGDKGYIGSEKTQQLAEKGITLITKTRKNMKKHPTTPTQNYLLSKRQK